MKSVEEINEKWILESCTTKNGEDPRLAEWSVIESTDNVTTSNFHPQVKKTLNYNYIYCFPRSINIDGVEVRCVEKVFRLKTNVSFEVGTYKYTLTRVTHNITTSNLGIIDTVHSGHIL